jgi:ABC-type phosphate/phosphonate transport system substrate-binding protein
VLFARKDRRASLEALKGLIAAWPDAQSMSGYVLPRTMMFALGMDPSLTLHKETFVGSFKACVEAVLDKRADVSATDASATDALPHVDGFAALAGSRAGELVSLGYTPDCPHGGIVLSPANKPDVGAKIEAHLLALMKEPETLAEVARTLGVDGFIIPQPNTYAPLRDFLLAPTKKLHVKLT